MQVATNGTHSRVQHQPIVRAWFAEDGAQKRIPKGRFLFMEGNRCNRLALIVSGTVRVYKSGPSGKAITLYRLGPLDTCILNAASILSDSPYAANAVAESDVEALVVPSHEFIRWVNNYTYWRRYIFQLLATRMDQAVDLIEELAFHDVKERLASYLQATSKRTGSVIRRTHEAVADDLGTAREVISRTLKDFERKGLVALARGTITVVSNNGLAQLGSGRNTTL